jgi:hypothetical protein
LTVAGLAFLGYGAVLAWNAKSAPAVLAIGAVFLFFALVLPIDWQRMVLKLGSASVEVERAKAEAAQETLARLPTVVRQQLVQPEDLPTALGWVFPSNAPPEQPTPAVAQPAGASPSESRARLIENLLTMPAFASHETFTDWVRLNLKRQTPQTDADLAVTCAVRKPDGEFLVGVPRLVSPTEPPVILGGWPRGGNWLMYEAVFPDFFATEADVLPPGTYNVIWGTLAQPGGRAHVLATDRFEWPPPDLAETRPE